MPFVLRCPLSAPNVFGGCEMISACFVNRGSKRPYVYAIDSTVFKPASVKSLISRAVRPFMPWKHQLGRNSGSGSCVYLQRSEWRRRTRSSEAILVSRLRLFVFCAHRHSNGIQACRSIERERVVAGKSFGCCCNWDASRCGRLEIEI